MTSNTGNPIFDAFSGVDMYNAEFKRTDGNIFEGEEEDPNYGVPAFTPAGHRQNIIDAQDGRTRVAAAKKAAQGADGSDTEGFGSSPLSAGRSPADLMFEGEDVKFFYQQYTIADESHVYSSKMEHIFRKIRSDKAGLLHERFSTDRDGNFLVLLAWWETIPSAPSTSTLANKKSSVNIHEAATNLSEAALSLSEAASQEGDEPIDPLP